MTRDRDDDRRSRRDDDRDERPSRSRDRDDDRPSRRSRDDDDRPTRSRGRDDDDRGSRRGRDRDDDDRSSRRGGSSFAYERRDPEDTKARGERGGKDFDRIFKEGIKVFTPADGDNCVRIVPPTWAKAKHYGIDLHVHYGVGPDRGSYLDLTKMLGKPDPITEEWEEARKDGDEKYAKEIESKRRCAVYVIDRNNEKEGIQAWPMPWTIDRDIIKVSQDKSTGEVLAIDHPEEGFDVMFEKTGKGVNTKYLGVAIARRESPLGKQAWLDQAIEKPLPDQLQYFDYDHIAKAFGAQGASTPARGGGRDDDDRDERRPARGRDDDDDRPSRGREVKKDDDEYTWKSLHGMTRSELLDVLDKERLDPKLEDITDPDELADEICAELEIKKPAASETRRRESDDERPRRSRDDDDDPPARRRREDDDDRPTRRREEDDDDGRLTRMRRNRED